jgi:hypothetical protein
VKAEILFLSPVMTSDVFLYYPLLYAQLEIKGIGRGKGFWEGEFIAFLERLSVKLKGLLLLAFVDLSSKFRACIV